MTPPRYAGSSTSSTTTLPCCFTVPASATFSHDGKLWEYYHFLVELAVPITHRLSAEAPGAKKTLILPGWKDEHFHDKVFGSVQPTERFYLTRQWDPFQTMQQHADTLLSPIGVNVINWEDGKESYENLPCKTLDWNPAARKNSAESLQFFRAYGHNLAGVAEDGWKWAAENPRVVLVRRATQSNATCTGACKKRLDAGFFVNVTNYLRSEGIPFVVVETDRMSLVKQVRVFAAANVIIGLEGAGLYNAIFSRPGAFLVEVVYHHTHAVDDFEGSVGEKIGVRYMRGHHIGGTRVPLKNILDEIFTTLRSGGLDATRKPEVAAAERDFAVSRAAIASSNVSALFKQIQLMGDAKPSSCIIDDIHRLFLVDDGTSPPQLPVPGKHPPCFKVPVNSTTSLEGGFFEYYHFLVEFAAPIAYQLRNEPRGAKSLVLPGWEEYFSLTYSRNTFRTMAAQARFIFSEGLSLNISYWLQDDYSRDVEPKWSSYQNDVKCKELDWNPGREDRMWSRDSPVVYRYFRDFATSLVQPAERKPSAKKIILIRRLAPQMPTKKGRHRDVCVGSCRRHLSQEFFDNAARFFDEHSVPYVIAQLESMNLREQIVLFGGASAIVGIHGAGLSNMLFSPAGTFVIELASPFPERDCYRGLAHQKLDLFYTLCKSINFGACVRDSILESQGLIRFSDRWLPARPVDWGAVSAYKGHLDAEAS